VGEAPVTPVYALDSSYLTFPTNRAITHQKDTKKQLSGASCIYIKYMTNYESVKPVALLLVND
jgi:hypothetical protein